MPNLKTAIDIFTTTGNAMAGLNFTYGARSEINANREDGYPRLILDRNITVQSKDIKKSKRVYTLIFQFYDLFHRDTEAINNDGGLQEGLEKLSTQYFKEVAQRLENTRRMRLQDVVQGEFTFMAANDRLLKLEYRATLEVHSQDCEEGVFNYG